MLSCIPEGACRCAAEGRMASIGPDGPRCHGLYRRVASLRSGGKASVGALWKYRGASLYKTFTTALAGEGKQTDRPSGDGNAPLSLPAAVLLLKGSMSLDSQSSTTPYESSSFATPNGGSLLSAFFSANLSSSLYSAARTSPSGGSGGASHR